MSHEREMTDAEYEEFLKSLQGSKKKRIARIALCGKGRSGKDLAAQWFNDNTSLRYSGFSTSMAITPHAAKHLGISEEEAFARRHEDRMLWYELGNKIRAHDPAFLARQTFQHGDIAVGIRDRSEMQAVLDEGLVDVAIWIDRDVPVDPTLTYGKELCHIVAENHGTVEEFYMVLKEVARFLGVLNEPVNETSGQSESGAETNFQESACNQPSAVV